MFRTTSHSLWDNIFNFSYRYLNSDVVIKMKIVIDAFQSCEDGISLRYRTDGRIFNPRRLQAITKVKETVIIDALFADDCALNASTEEKTLHTCVNFGLTPSALPKLKSCTKLLQASLITNHVSQGK